MMFARIRTKLNICILTVMIFLTPSCNQTTSTTEEEHEETITPVTIAPVMFKKVTSTVDLPAVTTFMSKSIIRATTTGIIQNISITQGDYVSVNQLLFSIRTRESMALGNTTGNDSSLIFKGIINITSTKEGVINSVAYQKGDFVQEGDELASISEQNSLVFILDVPFELDRYVERNRKCTIVLPDSKLISGTITGKLPEMNMETQTLRYVIKPADSGHLPANLIANVSLIRSTNDNAVVLPKKAVLSDETQSEFWVMKLVNDSVAVKVVVSKGFENNEEVEIIDPIFLSSDRIILSGNYGLQDTARISIIKE
jgi:multidrug efflux pump subunit AcrA (membrane-fusion protein)